jgi:gamma-glutamyltranspeptidase/glutathione hydrolase
MVAAAHPLAVLAGCRILEQGGSAADAAIAVQSVLALVEPQSSGLAGNTVVTTWDPDSDEVRFFDGLARAPTVVTENLATPTPEEQEELGITRFGSAVNVSGRAVGVPGTVHALELLHEAYGRMPWESLFEDAIEVAEEGFPLPPYLHSVLDQSVSGLPRCAYPDIGARYCDGDEPKPVGATIVNADLGSVLRELRDGGPEAFYDPDGTIAPAIVERATAGPIKPEHDDDGPAVIPSLMSEGDLTGYRAVEREPVCIEVLRRTVCSSAPPAFGGVAMLQMLALLERGDVHLSQSGSVERMHLSIEASRLANFDRREYVGDPDFHPVPIAGLLDDGYLDERFALYSPDAAIHPVEPGDPPGAPQDADASGGQTADEGGDATSHVSIIDADGRAVSMTTTNNGNFGAHLEARGMVLNNAQTNFTALTSISPGKPVNVMEPLKRPRTSMSPTIVLRDGRLLMVVGAAGGGPIPDFVTQTVVGVLVDRMNPFVAMSQPHYSGQEITGNCSGVIGPPSELESGTPAADLLDDLMAKGHPCARTAGLSSGSTAIEVRARGVLVGGADPRRDGTAMGH